MHAEPLRHEAAQMMGCHWREVLGRLVLAAPGLGCCHPCPHLMNHHQSMLQPSWLLQPANRVAATCQFDGFSGSEGQAGMDLPGLMRQFCPILGFQQGKSLMGGFQIQSGAFLDDHLPITDTD